MRWPSTATHTGPSSSPTPPSPCTAASVRKELVMARVVVIGATGHVGTFLIPRLVRAGHDVVAVSRGLREPYRPDEAWRGRADVRRHCSTIWVHGSSTAVPITEADFRGPFGDYGTWKAEIEDLLLAESELRCAVLRPGHITGPGWPMINAVGNLDLDVWHRLATGQPVTMPNFGLETVHHVHADDVAQAFQLALEHADVAVGNAYNIVSPRAMTLRGIATAVAGWFGRDADLRFVPFAQFRAMTSAELADASYEHIVRSHSMSIEKARTQLGYAPRYTTLQAIADGLAWLAEHGEVDLGPDPVPRLRAAASS